MKKRRGTNFRYSIRVMAAVLLLLVPALLAAPTTAYALPADTSMIQQLGGPLTATHSINMDDLIEKYATSRAYEARFYPFGEGARAPVFFGTAHYVRDLKKTDLEIAYYEAMRKSGTDENSLKRYYEYVAKYEAGAGISVSEMNGLLTEAASNAGLGVGAVLSDTASDVIGYGGIILGIDGAVSDVASGNVNANTFVSGAFTLTDIIAACGGIAKVEALSAVGGVASAGSVAWNTFWKYMEHQKEWKEFADYINGRRNLTEFFKWLEAELADAMKETTGWDVQFNSSEYVDEEQNFCNFATPVTYTFTGRFMHNYVPEFTVGSLGNANADGWVGQMELDMKADLSAMQEGWQYSDFCFVKETFLAPFRALCNTIYEDSFQVVENLYWWADLTCNNFPLKTESMDASQPQIVFTGSLASGSYNYHQGGNIRKDFHGGYVAYVPELGQTITAYTYTFRNSFEISQEDYGGGEIIENHWHYEYGDIYSYNDEQFADHGDIFLYEYALSHTEAKMVIDITKPLGSVTN